MGRAIDNEELRKMIGENPDLPLVFLAYNDEICFDYGCTVFEGCSCRVGTVWFDDEQTYDDEDEVIDDYMDRYCDSEEYASMSTEEFKEAIKVLVNEEVRHYKAIIVRIG